MWKRSPGCLLGWGWEGRFFKDSMHVSGPRALIRTHIRLDAFQRDLAGIRFSLSVMRSNNLPIQVPNLRTPRTNTALSTHLCPTRFSCEGRRSVSTTHLAHKQLPQPSDPSTKRIELLGGRRVIVADRGSGDKGTMIALHGSPGSHRDFRYVASPLEKEGIRVVRINFPGHGVTDESAVGVGKDAADGMALAELVTEIADVMQLKKPYIMAHSLGSQVGMNCALKYPDRFSGLILLSPAPTNGIHRMIRPYWLVKSTSYFHDVIDKTFLSPIWRWVLRQIWILWGFTPKITEAEVAHCQRRLHFVDFWDQKSRGLRLKEMRVPTLMAWSQDDPMIEEKLHHDMSVTMPGGPRLVFPDGGHFINKHYASDIAAATLEFISLQSMREDASRAGS